MRLTAEELIDYWKYFQYCCLPSIIMARYAYKDYIEDIKKEKSFYRHEIKHDINEIGKYLERLPSQLMDISTGYVRYMNILGDNIEENFEEDSEELHRAIYISFRNAKFEHLDCLAALHYISAMLQIATSMFEQCCEDLRKVRHRDVTKMFHVYNLAEVESKWDKIIDKASNLYVTKKCQDVDLNNLRVTKAIDAIRLKYADIETLREALRKSYPYSPNYQEDIPFEKSIDYLLTVSE